MQFRTHTDRAMPTADPPWLNEASRWALILAVLLVVGLVGIGLARRVAAEAGTSCTTRWDAGLQRYLTRCSDGR